MSLIFRDGCLEVSEAWAERDDLMEEVTGTLIYFWRLRWFSDIRWVTLGMSCRRLVLGLMTGIGNLAHLVLGIKKESKSYLKWFRPD